MSDASDLIASILAASAKNPQNKREPTLSDKPAKRQASSRWTTESICYLVTTTSCRCGATSTQTNPYPMIRRTHPKWGIHEEAIKGEPPLGMTVTQDHRHILIHDCHECLSTAGSDLGRQLDLFSITEIAHAQF